jgi:hypothetical protein
MVFLLKINFLIGLSFSKEIIDINHKPTRFKFAFNLAFLLKKIVLIGFFKKSNSCQNCLVTEFRN